MIRNLFGRREWHRICGEADLEPGTGAVFTVEGRSILLLRAADGYHALNNLGRILFLQRKYADAVKVLQQVLAVDPEDLQAHYNLMLCYNGLYNEKMSKEHQARYLRFKADEPSQAITGPYRQLNPEDNNERQSIHEHKSVPLPILNNARSKRLAARVTTNHIAADAFVRPAGQSPAAARTTMIPGAQR